MSRHRESIREAWESYRAQVMPVNAGRIQIQECRSAFYAGGLWPDDRDHGQPGPRS